MTLRVEFTWHTGAGEWSAEDRIENVFPKGSEKPGSRRIRTDCRAFSVASLDCEGLRYGSWMTARISILAGDDPFRQLGALRDSERFPVTPGMPRRLAQRSTMWHYR